MTTIRKHVYGLLAVVVVVALLGAYVAATRAQPDQARVLVGITVAVGDGTKTTNLYLDAVTLRQLANGSDTDTHLFVPAYMQIVPAHRPYVQDDELLDPAHEPYVQDNSGSVIQTVLINRDRIVQISVGGAPGLPGTKLPASFSFEEERG